MAKVAEKSKTYEEIVVLCPGCDGEYNISESSIAHALKLVEIEKRKQ